eukprot:TRINITY_DN6220_c0_g1_i1.p1 TRINITY_DN6220_c0_g1~~TRINITY_DN6220_c0_g1_i1.p1  ORF type:complete len:582 (-),score=88.14 TRINITY_DN6220_c0_g1_i1:775-2520(-)
MVTGLASIAQQVQNFVDAVHSKSKAAKKENDRDLWENLKKAEAELAPYLETDPTGITETTDQNRGIATKRAHKRGAMSLTQSELKSAGHEHGSNATKAKSLTQEELNQLMNTQVAIGGAEEVDVFQSTVLGIIPNWPKKRRLRYLTLKEIVESERVYCKSLGVLVDEFLTPVREQELLPKDQITVIFSNMDQVLTINRIFLGLLETKFNKLNEFYVNTSDRKSSLGKSGVESSLESNVKNFSEVLIQLENMKDVYATFITNFNESSDIVQKYMALVKKLNAKNAGAVIPDSVFNEKGLVPRFGRFLFEASQELNSLSGYLIMPIQRLPRYESLLRELLRHTPESHLDFVALKQSLAVVRDLNVKINEQKRKMDIEDEFNRAQLEQLSRPLELKKFSIGSKSMIMHKRGSAAVPRDVACPKILGRLKLTLLRVSAGENTGDFFTVGVSHCQFGFSSGKIQADRSLSIPFVFSQEDEVAGKPAVASAAIIGAHTSPKRMTLRAKRKQANPSSVRISLYPGKKVSEKSLLGEVALEWAHLIKRSGKGPTWFTLGEKKEAPEVDTDSLPKVCFSFFWLAEEKTNS